MESVDVILVGGGLANGLIALRLREIYPQLRLLLLEAEPNLGGNHTWSFFRSDVGPDEFSLLEPLVTHQWDGNRISFPEYTRELAGTYHSITADRFDAHLQSRLGKSVRTGCRVEEVHAHEVTLSDGRRWKASLVIDGRGFQPRAGLAVAYQKFLGLEVETRHPHGVTLPLIMDATVPQTDGYRFFYLLPQSRTRLLIEDTYYSDTPELDVDHLRAEVKAYIATKGWEIRETIREEQGVLPIVLHGSASVFVGDAGGALRSGLGAGNFHHTTGFSLPEAVSFAFALAGQPNLETGSLWAWQENWQREHWRRQSFFRMLNRMLFRATTPEGRYRVMQRFYRRPVDIVEGFYAGRLSYLQKLRILAGRTHVNLGLAVQAAFFYRS